MLSRLVSSDLVNRLSESRGEERRLPVDFSGGMSLCQVGSSSPLEFRAVNSDSITLHVVGGVREIARRRNSLTLDHRWLVKHPSDSQKYLSILVSRRSVKLTDGVFKKMQTVQQI